MDYQAREAVRAAFLLPAPLGDRLVRYLGLFRPKSRALSWDRVARLLSELLEPINAGRVERNGRAWVAPLSVWELALDEILAKRDKLQLPLKSHGYLFEIVAGFASKAEGAAEKHEIERERSPHRVLNEPGPRESGDPRVRDAALGALKHLTKKSPSPLAGEGNTKSPSPLVGEGRGEGEQ